MLTKKSREAENVSSEDRLAAYTVTRAMAGQSATALPLAEHGIVEKCEAPPPVQLHPVMERRGEPRHVAALDVCATHPGTATIVDGVTMNVSQSGMCLRMAEPPANAHQDVLVADALGASVLWVQVLAHTMVVHNDDLAFLWHVRVTAADYLWDELVSRLTSS